MQARASMAVGSPSQGARMSKVKCDRTLYEKQHMHYVQPPTWGNTTPVLYFLPVANVS